MNGVNDQRGFVPADSVLAVTAREIIAAHQPGPDTGATPVCRRCGAVAPCATVRAATQVVAATGVPVAAPGAQVSAQEGGPAADRVQPQWGYGGSPRTAPRDEPPAAPQALPMRTSAPVDARGVPVRIAAAS